MNWRVSKPITTHHPSSMCWNTVALASSRDALHSLQVPCADLPLSFESLCANVHTHVPPLVVCAAQGVATALWMLTWAKAWLSRQWSIAWLRPGGAHPSFQRDPYRERKKKRRYRWDGGGESNAEAWGLACNRRPCRHSLPRFSEEYHGTSLD